MRIRNKNFAEAFRWLKKNRGVKYQKDLATKVGVSEDTITRIMRDRTDVTDDFLCKFNDAFDNVFNYQWLRGEESNMFPGESEDMQSQGTTNYAGELIASLRHQLADKERIIRLLEQKIEILEEMQHLDRNPLKDYPFPIGAAEDKLHPNTPKK